MNKRNLPLLTTLTLLSLSPLAQAQSMGTSTSGMNAPEKEITMRDETLGIMPQIGTVAFTSKSGTQDGRELAGVGIDFNAASYYQNIMKDYFIGISTGVFYSHLGDPSSNFFGADASAPSGNGGASLVMIPADLKIGYNFTHEFRASVRGGGNIIYRSIANSTNLGTDSDGAGSVWKTYPNVGFDLEYQVGKQISLIARPDLTLTPANNLFMGTVGATLILPM